MKKRNFYVATSEEIKHGRTTDVYFERTKRVLEAKGKDRVRVFAEVTTGALPDGKPWGVLCGVEEVARLLEGLPVDVCSMPEGSLFSPYDPAGVRTPVMTVEGAYHGFCEYETPLLGFICHETGVASRAAYVKLAAGDKQVVAFGIRRIHPAVTPAFDRAAYIGGMDGPAVTPAFDRAAYIGGMDGVSSILGAEIVGAPAMGTMPHALIVTFGDQVAAWRAYDEKTEAIMAAEALGERLQAVRLDTPGSRRGDFARIIQEVRWELDIRGFNKVKIFVSGGLDEESVRALGEAGADAFGVGTWVSGGPTVDFALDIVEVEGRPSAKRGKLGGRKQVWRCVSCLTDSVRPANEPRPRCPACGGETEAMLKLLIKDGRIVAELPEPRVIREYVLEQLRKKTSRAW